MLKQYFNKTTETTFLKALLSAVQLPKFKLVHDGMLLFKDYFYIYKEKVVRCTQTGILGDTAKIEELFHYYFCDMDQNVEFKEFIRASYYSTELHKRTGEYLRCVRELYGIDLMGMYNCFSYELFSDLHIGYDVASQRNRIFVGRDETKKMLAVPIKFNQVYSIALTSSKPVYVSPVLKLPSGFKSFEQLELQSYTDNLGVQLLDSPQFNSLKTISVDLNESQGDFYKYERYLYLVFQVDARNDSSFVVLEGDYTSSNAPTIVGMSDNEEAPVSFIYKPDLLFMNDGTSYAYSDTLIQYLVHNVITNKDIIGENISYARNLLGFQDKVNYWSNNIRYSAFTKYVVPSIETYGEYSKQDEKNIRKNCKDVTGFIDKPIEEFLNATL